jgi:membrane protease YdiL (CAAX protease family)
MSEPAAIPPEPPVHGPGEAIALLLVGLGLSFVAARFFGDHPGTVDGAFRPLVLFLAWVGPAYALASRRGGRDPLEVHGVIVPVRAAGPAALVSLALLAAYALGWLAWTRLARIPPGAATASELGEGAIGWFTWGFVFVALPEEYFFRGVLQPAFDTPGGRRVRLLGAELGRGALVSALAFGVGHIALDLGLGKGLGVERAATALPGLWFAWLRARTGSIVPAAIAHAAANAVAFVCHEAVR